VETNRRHFPRQKGDTSIQVLFAQENLRDEIDRYSGIAAKIGNQSQDGLYIETDHALSAGSIIRLKIASPENDHPANVCYVHDCQVVWHKKIHDKIPRFGIGVRILRRNVQADVMTSRFL